MLGGKHSRRAGNTDSNYGAIDPQTHVQIDKVQRVQISLDFTPCERIEKQQWGRSLLHGWPASVILLVGLLGIAFWGAETSGPGEGDSKLFRGSDESTIVGIDESANESSSNQAALLSPSFPLTGVENWHDLPWYGTDRPQNTTKLEAEKHFIGYLKICELSHRNGQSLVYQAATLVQGRVLSTCDPKPPTTAAPIIRMQPGNHYQLVLINNLNEETNLHTHGLHISGVGTADDVTRTVSPGYCLVYNYLIPNNADVGTFWYHSHRHPFASRQVARGAYGLLLVEEDPELLSTHYPPHLRSFLKREVLLQYASILDSKTKHRTNLINGVMQHEGNRETESKVFPLIEIPLFRKEWYYFRVSFVVLSDPVNFIEFQPAGACEVRVIAYDGVYRSSVPSSFTLHKHMMTLSSRADFAIRCNDPMATIHFHQGSISNSTGLVSILTKSQVLSGEIEGPEDKIQGRQQYPEAQQMTNASPYWDMVAKTAWAPRRPYYMGDLRLNGIKGGYGEEESIDQWEASMDNFLKNGTKTLSISQDRWDPNKPIRSIGLGQLAEWTLLNTKKHPFHIHINRMQIVQPGGCGYRYEQGEYYDTIAASVESCLVRLRFQDYAGRVIAHCHKLSHEDRGMMVWINVTGGPGAGILAAPQQICSGSGDQER